MIQDVQALCRDAGFLLLTATDVVPEQYTKFCKKLNREHDRTTETHRAYANVPYEAVEGFSNVYVVNLYAPMHIKLTEERIDQGKNAATLLDSRYFTDGELQHLAAFANEIETALRRQACIPPPKVTGCA